ncbi:CTD phosphatase Fcp1 [Marasmius crinis-equi]|uniref:RNA polymerase II subunit A C-terminal domain phosphatase n=1 Tax=Marasmius crinis-equi TaxID=585013 RepID=A0ABR3FIX2_9AGAR
MEPSPTELFLPQSFPYPIKVTSIDANVADSVERGTRLLSYSFTHLSRVPGSKPETRFGTWDCAIEGTVQKWNVKPGDTISQRHAKDTAVVVVLEPCKHGMQLGGLCVLCGKDMTNSDYIGFSDASRASIQMTHSAFGPTVSFEEAQRIERETAQRLLKSRKLSLIVDLDQTIVHATVDPTVGEWISEGEAWETRQAGKSFGGEGSGNPADNDDECNPNWEALKDVKKFRLGPETLGVNSSQKGKSAKALDQGCMYYIKPRQVFNLTCPVSLRWRLPNLIRPGWKEFLKETAAKYEMHVYTMGTRAYAEQVCAAIDPDGSIFGGRLLSRDESGSLTQKSLQRLFPCDTSMVVIIDDRADVWEWSPNLIKVVPYEFFVGIGDINSAFLPKLEPLTAATPQPTTPPPKPSESPEALTPDPLGPTQAEDPDRVSKEVMITQNSLALEAQVEERPLAKRQEELQDVPAPVENKAPEASTASVGSAEAPPQDENAEQGKNAPSTNALVKVEKTPRKALLKNDDRELDRVKSLLDEIHRQFFVEYDSRATKDSKHHKSKTSRKEVTYDVTRIIPTIRSDVLKGVHLLFSSVIPLDTRPESTEIWRMAHMFGAKCSTELTPDITHVVAAKRGTVKVEAARKRPNVKVVWLTWFTDSIASWRHQEETPYLLDDPPVAGPSSSPTTDLNQISSDPDIDEDEDWDIEASVVSAPAAGGGGSFSAEQINWDDINDEVEAAMMESDDEDDDAIDVKSERSEMRSENVSEDEWSDESNSVISANNSPRVKRKRLRSLTPSEAGVNGESDVLRSPLSKRKKLAADRTGFSRLKEAISAEDLHNENKSQDGSSDRGSGRNTPVGRSPRVKTVDDMDDGEDDGDDEDEDIEDDFLARELEEEWG